MKVGCNLKVRLFISKTFKSLLVANVLCGNIIITVTR